MKIEEFKAGKFVPCYQYSCFVPEKVNHFWTWDSRDLTMALERAVKALAALDACSQFVPDIDLFPGGRGRYGENGVREIQAYFRPAR